MFELKRQIVLTFGDLVRQRTLCDHISAAAYIYELSREEDFVPERPFSYRLHGDEDILDYRSPRE